MKRLLIASLILMTNVVFAAEQWDSSKVYDTAGSQVVYNGVLYENFWWTHGDNPADYAFNPWHVWRPVENIAPDPDPTPDPDPEPAPDPGPDLTPETVEPWDSEKVYHGGDLVSYGEKVYVAHWWNQGESPGKYASNPWHVWRPVENIAPEPTPDPEPTPEPEPTPDPAPDPFPNPVNYEKKVAGYYTEWSIYGRDYMVTDLPVQYITHINYAFLKIENGKVALWDSWAAVEKRFREVVTAYGTYPAGDWEGKKAYYGNLERLNKLDELVNAYYKKDIKLMFSVGGWTGSSDFPEVTRTAASRKVFIDSLVDYLRKYKFEGVSYDWEFPVLGPRFSYSEPRPEESAQLVALLKETREAFDELKKKTAVDYEITVALNLAEKNIEDIDLESVARYADNLDVMTYDVSAVAWGNAAGHQSPIYHNSANPDGFDDPTFKQRTVNASVQFLVSRGVPRGKIMIGSPSYGRSGRGIYQLFQESGTVGGGTWEPGCYDYDSILGKSSKLNLPTDPRFYYWDDVAKASYYINSAGEFVSYDSLLAVEEKCRYIKEQDLGGWFIWEFSGNRDGDLIEAAFNAFNSPEPEEGLVAAVSAPWFLYRPANMRSVPEMPPVD